jgi:hypothetical protein
MKYIFLALTALCSLLIGSCGKEFLEKRPNKALLVPQAIGDFQGLTDDFSTMNKAPGMHIIASDDRYITDELFQTLPDNEKDAYIWAEQIDASMDWKALYRQVFYCNIALEGLNKLSPSSSQLSAYNQAKGSALFFRAYAFFQLADIFALPYDPQTAEQTPGILLRLSPDVNMRPSRASLLETFRQITADLELAATLLPDVATLKTRPNAPAAFGLLARAYLYIGKYDLAFTAAGNSLSRNNKLLNYNTLPVSTASNTFPVALPNGNDEVLFSTGQMVYTVTGTSALALVDPALYALYDANDLRKTMYYRDRGNGNATFKASYNGNLPLLGSYKNFSGIAVDEVYLTRAECLARLNRPDEAMADLNTLLITRWKTGTFQPYTAASQNDALRKVLSERRKSLFSRGIRWMDLKRLNREPEFAVTLTRIVAGQEYTLAPGSNRYAFPFPDDELTDLISQNLR